MTLLSVLAITFVSGVTITSEVESSDGVRVELEKRAIPAQQELDLLQLIQNALHDGGENYAMLRHI